MKYLKKCPLFLLLSVTGVLLSLTGAGGMKSIYAGQAYDPLTAPLLSVVFTGIKDEIYPWQIFSKERIPAMAGGGEAPGQEQPLAEGEEDRGVKREGRPGRLRTMDIFSDTLESVISGMEEEAKKAEEEGFPEVARHFQQIAEIEKVHAERFERFAKLLREEKLFVSDVETGWMCLNCGHVFQGTKVPGKCPVCSHDQGYFIRVELSPYER